VLTNLPFNYRRIKYVFFTEQEANLFEYQLMHHQPNAAGHLSGASSSADPHAGGGAADSAFSAANTAGFPGAPAGTTNLKQLPTLFQWDFKTTTETPSAKSAQSHGAEPAASPLPRSATAQNRPSARPATSKAPRTTTAVTTTTTPVTAATTTQEEEEETPATASRIPKIYLNNPKIDPFTESPALAPEVFNKLCFFNLFILLKLKGLSLN
jgi:hypothetical protein